MDKRIMMALIATGLLLFALVSFVSAPSKNIEIKDKREEHISVVPGAVFCVERNLSSKGKAIATIAPLFSDGLTLESIDLKKTTTEIYTVDVPDYGTCVRDVAMNFTTDTRIEQYPCITGYHQEERTREVVTYEPVKGGYYDNDKSDKNDKEKEVEGYREMLPEKLKGLNNVGYSNDFDLENSATIRMCFKAPEWGSEITSGTISYLTYMGGEQDYESSTAWDFYSYRMRINCSNMADSIPLVINGSNGFSSLHGQECGKQIVWTYCSGINTSLYYNNCLNYSVWNSSEQLPMDVSIGNVGSYNAKDVYTNGILVAHLDENTGASLRDSTRHSNASILGAENEWVYGRIGYAVNFTSTTNGNIINNTHLGQVSLNQNDTNTIVFWVRPFTTGAYKEFFDVRNVGGYILYTDATNTLKWFSDSAEFATGTAINYGTWLFVAAVSDNASNRHIYLNGNHNASTTTSKTVGATQTISFMGYYNGLYHPSGTIDEIMVFNTNLSAGQINATYQNQIGTAGYGNLGPEETSSGGQQGGNNNTEVIMESNSSGSIIISPAGEGKVKFTASLTDGSNEVSIVNMKAAYEHIAQDFIESISDWQGQCSSCVGASDINASEVQRRVQNFCIGATAIHAINADGTVTCVDVSSGGSGDITDVWPITGSGLTGGSSSGSVSIGTDFNTIQKRVSGVCAIGNSIREILSDGTVTCEPDDVGSGSGGGDITDVFSGVGTKGGATSGSATIEFACSEVSGSHLTCSGETINVNDDWVNANGDTMTGDLILNDGSGYSPAIKFIEPHGKYMTLFIPDFTDSAAFIQTSAGTDIWLYPEGNQKSCRLEADTGSWNCYGAKNAEIYVPEINETVYMHAIEGDEVLHVMKGTAQLEKGKLTIILPEKFQYVISENSTPNVQVTPLSKCNLYVSDKKWNAFTVESFGGDANCKFDWIIFATRRGYDNIGMEKSGIVVNETSYCSSQKKIGKEECVDRFDKHDKRKGQG